MTLKGFHRSKVNLLCSGYESVVSCMTFVKSVFVLHLYFFWCLRRAAIRHCGVSWIFSLKFIPRMCLFLCLSVLFIITKTRLYNFDPIKHHFYIVKLGFTGVYIIFLISAQNIDCGYSLEPPRQGGSNEYPQSMFLSRNIKKYQSL